MDHEETKVAGATSLETGTSVLAGRLREMETEGSLDPTDRQFLQHLLTLETRVAENQTVVDSLSDGQERRRKEKDLRVASQCFERALADFYRATDVQAIGAAKELSIEGNDIKAKNLKELRRKVLGGGGPVERIKNAYQLRRDAEAAGMMFNFELYHSEEVDETRERRQNLLRDIVFSYERT